MLQALRLVDKTLESELVSGLLNERENYMQEHLSFRMIGPEFVCPLSVIYSICSQARFIHTVDDLREHFGLRPDLRERFFLVSVR